MQEIHSEVRNAGENVCVVLSNEPTPERLGSTRFRCPPWGADSWSWELAKAENLENKLF